MRRYHVVIIAVSAGVVLGLGTPRKNGAFSLRRRSIAQPFGHLHLVGRSYGEEQEGKQAQNPEEEDIAKVFNREHSRRLRRRRNNNQIQKYQSNAVVVGGKKDNLIESPAETMRRQLLLSSALFLSSALLAPESSRVANAMTDSEARLIDIFDRTAPAVVFIDTFAERQDAFSTNVLEVPLGTGTGFVWDNEGHIGKLP